VRGVGGKPFVYLLVRGEKEKGEERLIPCIVEEAS